MQDTDYKEKSLVSRKGKILLMDDEDIIREAVGDLKSGI